MSLVTAAKRYPIVVAVIIGLLTGACSTLAGHTVNRPALLQLGNVVFAVTALIGGVPIVWTTIRHMLSRRFNVDTIAALAIVSALAMHHFLAAALVVLMQSGGEAIEDYGLRRASKSLDNLLRRAPSIAHKQEGESIVDVAAASVVAGDILLIRSGDIIAADGVVVDGVANVDEAALTGEPIPLAKGVGDRVYSGTVSLSGSFMIRATSTAAGSKYEHIVRMVQQAQGERAPINRLADRYTPGFTALALGLAAVAWWISGDPVRALAVLVVATPCPLIIATPLAVISAVNWAASLNIIVKSGAAIEQAAGVDTVVFDKTGTLTVGTPQLADIRIFDPDLDRSVLLAEAAAVELHSAHILAQTVVDEARREGLAVQPAECVREVAGKGIEGQSNGHQIAIGARDFVAATGVKIDEGIDTERRQIASEGRTVAFIARDGVVAGMLIFQDRLRREAPSVVRRLRELGISQLVMLTGDVEETATAIARQTGITDVAARLHPEDKLDRIKKLSQSHSVMMVGDGINDAPALSASTVGVAMGGQGAGIATDAADVVVTVDNIERIADVIVIGRRMLAVARQGILFGIGASLIMMVFAAAGAIQPATGAFLQEAIDLVAVLNALRARG